MKVSELITIFRQDVRDVALPTLWSDTEVVRYLNNALNELAIRADYFYDTTTYMGVRFVADDPLIPTVTIPALETVVPTTPDLAPILRIHRAKVVGEYNEMSVLTTDQMEGGGATINDYGTDALSNWETSTGTPRVLLTDFVESAYRLAPIPTADGTVNLRVFRRPMFVLKVDTDQAAWNATCASSLKGLADIQTEEHELTLLHWMKHRAYMKNDAETFDTDESARFRGLFLEEAAQIKNELQRKRFPTGPVRYGGL